MTKRTKIGQKKHDEALLKSVKYYEDQGFKVMADLPGGEKPKEIKGFIPDLIAKKGGKEIILEVETKTSVKQDKDQLEAFEQYADNSKNRKFRKKIC